MARDICPDCDGDGMVRGGTCRACGGHGDITPAEYRAVYDDPDIDWQ